MRIVILIVIPEDFPEEHTPCHQDEQGQPKYPYHGDDIQK
jgi:hypothetical protein